jgi:hypothetical protein
MKSLRKISFLLIDKYVSGGMFESCFWNVSEMLMPENILFKGSAKNRKIWFFAEPSIEGSQSMV